MSQMKETGQRIGQKDRNIGKNRTKSEQKVYVNRNNMPETEFEVIRYSLCLGNHEGHH